MSIQTSTTINDNEYIGDSLVTINNNFSNLDLSIYTLVQTLTGIASTSTSYPTLCAGLIQTLNGLYNN
jgi:hypothetical protein